MSGKIPWMTEVKDRCDHYNFKLDYSDIHEPTFRFGTWEEQGYFACSRCGFRVWEGQEHYKELYQYFSKMVDEGFRNARKEV